MCTGIIGKLNFRFVLSSRTYLTPMSSKVYVATRNVLNGNRDKSQPFGDGGFNAMCCQCEEKGWAHGHLRCGQRNAVVLLAENETENRSEFALAGDVVNLAARLAAASEKEERGVLCDEATLESLTGEVRSCYGMKRFDTQVPHTEYLIPPYHPSGRTRCFLLCGVFASQRCPSFAGGSNRCFGNSIRGECSQ